MSTKIGNDHAGSGGARDKAARPSRDFGGAAPPRLTVLVPVYNEERTIEPLLRSVAAAPYAKQIVVVDDGSQDGTARLIEQWLGEHDQDADAVFVRHATNRGKGAAIRTGLRLARGDVVIVQDADLEYDPADYPALVEPILSGHVQVVYGSRFLSRGNRPGAASHRLCSRLLNATVWLLYGRRVTDEATCYKVFRTDLLRRLDLRCERFEFCPEVTAKLCRLGIPIHEVPIRNEPRSAAACQTTMFLQSRRSVRC